LLAGSGLQAVKTAEKEFKVIRGQASEAEEPTEVLPGITVKGEPIAEPCTQTITADVISRIQAQDMYDVFSTEPSISVGGGARNAQRIYVRGIEASNLNVTLDGAQQNKNLHQHRGATGNIDPSLLKRVDVHPGPGADQGPGALGGSIRFETVDAQDRLKPGRNLGATISSGYGTVDEAWIERVTVYGQVGHLGLLAHGSSLENEDYEIGGGDRDAPCTAVDDRDYMAKASLLDVAGHDLRMSADHNVSKGTYVWGSTGSDMGYVIEDAVPVKQRIERNTYNLDHRFQPGNPLIDTRLHLYLVDNSLEDKDNDIEYESLQIGGDLRNTFKFDLGPIHQSITVGTDYLDGEDEAPRNRGRDKGKIIENDSYNLGLFLQDRMRIGPLGISFGARYDDFEADYGHGECNGDKLSPNVGIEYEVLRGLTAFANYGEAARGSGLIPSVFLSNIDEFTNINDGKSLKAETSKHTDGGLRYRNSDLFLAGDYFNIEASVFRTRLENLIEAIAVRGGVIQKIWNNPMDVVSTGWELRAGWGLKGFETNLGFIHVDVEDQHGDPIAITRRKVAPVGDRLVWDSHWQVHDRLLLGYTLTAVASLDGDDVAPGQSERPGYTVHDVQAQWSPTFVDGLILALAVHNLFDHRYSDQTSLEDPYYQTIVEEPGVDVRFMATYRF
jgi:hemoglobin/transferrin/lactoferrin receptor protein